MKNAFLILILLPVATISFSQKTGSINNIHQLTDSIEAILKKEKIIGLMLGITTKDSVIFSGGFGYADLDTKRKVDEVHYSEWGRTPTEERIELYN